MTWHHPCPQKASPLARHSVKRRDYSRAASSSGSSPVLWAPSCRMVCGCDKNTGWEVTHLHSTKGEAQLHRYAPYCRLLPAWILHSLSLLFPLEWFVSTIDLWGWFWNQREGEREIIKGGEKEGYRILYETQGSEASYTYLGPSLPKNSLNWLTRDLFGASLYTTLYPRGTSLGSQWQSQGGSLYVWSPTPLAGLSACWTEQTQGKKLACPCVGGACIPAGTKLLMEWRQARWKHKMEEFENTWASLKSHPFLWTIHLENQVMGAPWIVDLC